MSEPTSPEPLDLRAAERLHPLFLLTGLGGSLRALAGGYAAVGYLALSGRLTTAIIGAVALLVMMAVGIVLYWTRFEFRVGENEIRIDSGILSRTHRSIPFDRIQDVDISQGPVARLLGLARVTFETGSAAVGHNAAEGVLHAIALERAQEIRALIRSHRLAEAFAPSAEPVRGPVYAMDLKRLLLAGTFRFSLAIVAGLLGITQTYGDVVGFDPLSRRFWTGVLSAQNPIVSSVLQHRAAAAIAGAVVLLLIGLLTGVTRTLLRDYGFRVDRTDAGLRRRRGLLTRTDVTLPVRRAQAAVLRSGPLRDAFGWSEVTLQSLARDDDSRGDHVLAPLAREAEAAKILAELGWKPLPGEIAWTRVSSAYVAMLALAIAPLFLVAALLAALSYWWAGAAFAGALTLLIGTRWLAWNRTGYALDRDRLLIRSGWWRRRLVVLPFGKIQAVDVSESFISRWFGLATLRFGVAGGSVSGEIIPAIPSVTARQLRDRLLDSGA